MSQRSTRRWSGRWCRCWRAWRNAASRSTVRCCRASPASSRRSRPVWRTRSTSSPARRSISASPKLLGDILFGKMGLPGGKKTKTGHGRPARRCWTSWPSRAHELPPTILDWRQVSKLRSTYTDVLPDYVNPDTGRIHTSYALAATTTGRLSSSEPNLQNIPIRTEEGRKIRRAFIADDGCKLVSADYSQIELRLLAEVADVPALAQGVQGRPRHSRHDGVGNVRRAGQGHAGRDAPPRQGDQLRHHLRHLGVRARQPARHRARRGRRLHQEILRALPRHPRLHGGDQGIRQEERLRAARCSAARCHFPGHRQFPLDRAFNRARRDQRAARRARRPTSSAAPWCAIEPALDESEAHGAACCSRCTTN